MNMNTIEITEPLVVTRLIQAPRERVFEAWTTPELAQWICPGAERVVVSAIIDLRVGGAYDILLEQDGEKIPFHGIYREICKPSRLVFTWTLGDCFPEFAGHPSQVTVDLAEEAGGTRVTLTHEGLPNVEISAKHGRGWSGSLDNLETRV